MIIQTTHWYRSLQGKQHTRGHTTNPQFTDTLEVERVGLHDCYRLNCSVKHAHTAHDYFRWVMSK